MMHICSILMHLIYCYAGWSTFHLLTYDVNLPITFLLAVVNNHCGTQHHVFLNFEANRTIKFIFISFLIDF